MKLNLYGLIISLIALLPILFEYLFKMRRNTRHLELRNLRFISLIGLTYFSIFSIFGYGYHKINDILNSICFSFLSIVVMLYYLFFTISFIKRNEYLKLNYRLNVKLFRGMVFLIPSIFMFNPYTLFFSISYIILEILIEVKK